MKNNIDIKNYIQFNGNNPFGSQAKLLFHIDRLHSYLFQRDCSPVSMEISLTNRCNLNCSWCINSNFRGKEALNFKSLAKFLKEAKQFGLKGITLSGGGEPTIYSQFLDTVQLASYLGFDIGLMTNGGYSDNEQKRYNETIGNHIKWARFSVDTIDETKYKRWKGANLLSKVFNNVKELKNYPIKVGINCNISEEHTIKDVRDLINYFTDDVEYIQFRPILPRYYKQEKVYLNEKVWNYLIEEAKKNSKINLSNDKLNDVQNNNFFGFMVCDGHFFQPILTASGTMCTCMYHPDDDRFVLGNIYQNSFKEIWESEKRKKVINFVRTLDYKNQCQACCKNTEINKLLDYINHPSQGGDINHL